MAKFDSHFITLVSFLLIIFYIGLPCSATAPRKLALVQPQPLVLKYHNGPLLKGNLTVNLIWYGKFSSIQRSIIIDFIQSLSSKSRTSHPSVSSWWEITGRYKGGPCTITLGKQIFDQSYSLGKVLTPSQLVVLSSKLPHRNAINVVLTSADVAPDSFCMSSCGAHGSDLAGKHKKIRFAYAWVGNPEKQCPGQCAWPFHQPIYGPQSPPLIAPNGDVGVDGMIMNLATVLAGAVTNPFDNGYFQGPVDGGLEAVSACTGMFGSGSYPGYPGKLLVDRDSGASFNAYGIRGRKYLLPAMWDPKTSACKTLV
ncbi:protein EXORDIUM-like 2 [Amaranthus tricolor]|uniref:protein EXORDIUM-like 2 n=1 Tax=Amaranthus tricolor TaxID=29722 RepID=UPI00258E8424|nr:protein EXORDIUM-like 2 [Amaranthus tricolor]